MSSEYSEHRIVSAESEELILVNIDDSDAGYLDKGQCHDGDGVLHRAFSLFLFNCDGELLLQQRSADKRLWPLYWSNSCCSHPRRGESLQLATQRRLADELNVSAELEFIYKFAYQASYGEAGSENELCSVFLGRCEDDVIANKTEIAAVRFVKARNLADEFRTMPEKFTPWFSMEWDQLNSTFREPLARYADLA
ncbi:MAG: isopentenyl-diphosphate Delta-isomerase [Gammaproteobacteria bacterium]|nr:isopentenyl-diphosphate Delta-isomerase [Gammaproteobacteria bacterium]MDH4313470.1 isopentenyl-diphosphate Delta-isomerase [Gammaproteobacteria bacterium]MDH5213046.1 isopentenyl-diphosphate Delta-isomerase [Gammaproteobacteria bacterium]MDH5501192.1 isopentenyl-diphosphate Delta-isomerase [Gammaproteobacteria bacterium]